ncbi:hypothetical protein N7536_012174 [Penicillium majusculum]|nr:hypothetical protein N7536_012174 [Penicillium majusculum]
MATSESQAQLPPDDSKWYDEDVLVSDQSLGLPDVGTFNLYKMTPPLKEREGLFVLLPDASTDSVKDLAALTWPFVQNYIISTWSSI